MCKEAGNVACCCFNCALSVLLSIISAFLVIIIIGGGLIYYFYYYDQDTDHVKSLQDNIQDGYESGVDKFKDILSKAQN